MRSYFFNDRATTEIYTLSLHDALPICCGEVRLQKTVGGQQVRLQVLARYPSQLGERVELGLPQRARGLRDEPRDRSEEHTSELQSRQYLVCRLLLVKKNITQEYSLGLQ